MMQPRKKHLSKEEKIGVILMDLLRTFDTINHGLLLEKLDAYGFSRTSLKLIRNYLCNRQQRSSINVPSSNRSDIITRFPKASFWVSFCLIYF